MPITKSAKKALRNSAHKRDFNFAKRDAIKKIVKKVKKLVAEKKPDEARKLIPEMQKIIDKALKTNVLKKNTAARKKSRIVAMIKRAQ
jgi:small subunit ribosomal protein S20